MGADGRCCADINAEAVSRSRIVAEIAVAVIGLDREIIGSIRKVGNGIGGYIADVDITCENAGRCSVIEPIARKVSEGTSVNICCRGIPSQGYRITRRRRSGAGRSIGEAYGAELLPNNQPWHVIGACGSGKRHRSEGNPGSCKLVGTLGGVVFSGRRVAEEHAKNKV